MVAFTCNNCGASVKKNVVEKHNYQQCHTRIINLTCIDCLQDFSAETYGAHIKCLTENEKYGAKGTVERSNNKGEIKQQDWLSMIADVYETHSLDFKHKQILEHILKFDNIPRKKKPFLNFMKSSARMLSKSEAVVESLYDLLDKEFKSRTTDNNSAKTNPAQNKAEPKYKETNDCDETALNDKEVTSEKKKKRRNKHKSESREIESSAASDDAETSQAEHEVSENHPPTPEESDSAEKPHLSKKEKKEKKKREKYLTELNEIEKYEKSEETNVASAETAESEETGKKKKAKKNRHKSESETETAVTKTKSEETNGVENASNPVPLERKLSKKEKKRKISENAAAEGEAKKKLKNQKGGDDLEANENHKENGEDENEEFIKPDKFKIDKVVRIILESQGGEVALKRLAKRVCTEYQIRCGIQDSDYIMAKFQKKIFHIPGVKILKDKAVLQ